MPTGLRRRPNFKDIQVEVEGKSNKLKTPNRDAKKKLSEKLDEKLEKRTANLQLRRDFKKAELRNNLRMEYDRLAGESLLIPQIKARHGERVATNTAKTLGRRLDELQKMYKESVTPSKHPING